MPTAKMDALCLNCSRPINEHSGDEANTCHDAVHEAMYCEGGYHDQQKWLHDWHLTEKEPHRIGSQCCAICRAFLPGDWGTVRRPEGNICGACARDDEHDCYANAVHISIPDSYMGSGDSKDYWQCKICERPITVGELLKRKTA